MKPIDALQRLIEAAYLSTLQRRAPVGFFVQNAKGEVKEAIEELKSDDIKNVRIK